MRALLFLTLLLAAFCQLASGAMVSVTVCSGVSCDILQVASTSKFNVNVTDGTMQIALTGIGYGQCVTTATTLTSGKNLMSTITDTTTSLGWKSFSPSQVLSTVNTQNVMLIYLDASGTSIQVAADWSSTVAGSSKELLQYSNVYWPPTPAWFYLPDTGYYVYPNNPLFKNLAYGATNNYNPPTAEAPIVTTFELRDGSGNILISWKSPATPTPASAYVNQEVFIFACGIANSTTYPPKFVIVDNVPNTGAASTGGSISAGNAVANMHFATWCIVAALALAVLLAPKF